MHPSPTALAVWLRDRFGHDELRTGQVQVVDHLLRGRRVLFVAPTGHGKSLCYQALAADATRGVVLVFQPLKALMREQVERARGHGLRAELLNSDLDVDAQHAVLERAMQGQLDMLFLAPERQGNPLWQETVWRLPGIGGVVIDEAHCISQWGHDFRPWYRRLVEIVGAVGLRTPVLAVTATAPRRVVDDIVEQIAPDGDPVHRVRLDSHRANLGLGLFHAQSPAQRLAKLAAWVRTRGAEPGIVYCLTTNEAEGADRFLRRLGFSTSAYHGKLDDEARTARLRRWASGQVRVICATAALGMGVDRRDVRWIVHLGLPDTLLRYVQEIGRAGRDDQPAWCVAIHDPGYADIYRWLLHSTLPSPDDVRAVAGIVRAGARPVTRTEIIADTDVPETDTQHILDDLRRQQLVERDPQARPYRYRWVGGDADPVGPDVEAAVGYRVEALRGVFAYGAVATCRAAHLAEVMQDATRPAPCGRCDRCATWAEHDWHAELPAARASLSGRQPEINLGKIGGRARVGRALSLWGEGAIGDEVREAKQAGRAVAEFVIDAAARCVRDADGPYVRVPFEAIVCVPPTRSGDFVPDFARRLAARLGLPCIELAKTRPTAPQKRHRSRHHKRRNVRDAFALPPGVVGPRVAALLVDDVWGSGETLKAAARAIRPAFVMPLTMARRRGRS